MFLLSTSVFADLSTGNPELTFTSPVEFTDGSILDPLKDIKEYRLYCGRITGYTIIAVSPLIDGVQTTQLDGSLFDVGSHDCQLTSVTLDNIESAASDSAIFDMPVIINQSNPAKRVLTIIIN